MQTTTAMNEQLAERLEAFALERLSPDAGATERMRRVVMGAASTRLMSAATLRSLAPQPEPTPIFARRIRISRPPRRLVAGLLAASLALGTVAGAAFAAEPGGPLYDARLWIEQATLPVDADARADAEIARLDARLDEAVRATSNGNGPAVSAALAAYRATIEEALEGAGGPGARSDRLEIALGRHLVVLTTLLGEVPPQARDAIQRAIDNGGSAVDRIDRAKPAKPDPQPTPKPGNGGGNGNGGNGGGPGPRPHPTHPVEPGSGGKPGG